jgi:chromate transporter
MAWAAPGPNIMFVALLGHFIAGAPGAVVATVAICGPSCVLAYAVSQVVERFREARWRIAIQAGLVRVTIGLIAASALITARAADHDWAGFAVTAATFAFVYWTRLSPLVAFACAAPLGLGGFV